MQRAIEGELNLFLSIRKRNLKQTKLLTINGEGTRDNRKTKQENTNKQTNNSSSNKNKRLLL